MASQSAARSRRETQGYVGVGDRTLSDIQFGLRFAPALCSLGVALGTAFASPFMVLFMMATAALGAAFPHHPFDLLYNYGVRFLLRKPPIPRNSAPRRFSCAVGAVWLAAAAAAFFLGWSLAGYVLGAAMAGMAGFVAVTHICLPSLVYMRLFEHVGDVPEITVEEARRRLSEGALLVDLRDRDYWRAGHAPGAINVPVGELVPRTELMDRDRTLLVVCQSGVSSLKGAKVLREAGFPGTCSVRGGMTAWLKRGLPIEQGAGFGP